MTPRAALDELIARIEANELDPSDADEDRTEIVISALGNDNHSLFFAAWDSDVSLALTLKSSLVPGARIILEGSSLESWGCTIYPYDTPPHSGYSFDPARAILLAILRARIDVL